MSSATAWQMAFLSSGGIPKSEASNGGPAGSAGCLIVRDMVSETSDAELGSSGGRCGNERSHLLVTQVAGGNSIRDLVSAGTASRGACGLCVTEMVVAARMLVSMWLRGVGVVARMRDG